MGFINPILSGSTCGLLSFICKKFILKSHVGIFLYDIRSICNGFLAGVVGMSVGSAGMQPYWAVLCGAITAPLYIGACLIFRAF